MIQGACEQGNIFWLASYPKSGNTWVRTFIANLLTKSCDAVHINQIYTGEIASSREWIESAIEFSISELSHDEIDRLRPHIYTWLSKKMASPQYHKIHDAYQALPGGQPLIPYSATRGVLVIVRNPLDVAVSFAHHFDCSIDDAIKNMNDSTFTFSGRTDKQHPQLRQKLFTWSEHVKSWLDAPLLNRLLVRYEDMLLNSVEEFYRIAKFLELPSSTDQLNEAIKYSEFTRLRKQEENAIFREKKSTNSVFFRKGIAGDWKNSLTDSQVFSIISNHKKMMMCLGYVDEKGDPIE